MKNKHIITALVKNHSGVLTRISGLFARRCFNIDSLVVCATENPELSRMTIVSDTDDAVAEQMVKQLEKLVDVLKVRELEDGSISRELLLVKIKLSAAQRPEIESTCNIYKAKLVDLSAESVVVELSGEPNKLDALIKILEPYGIIELSRTGVTALERGRKSIND
ncbi:MAG: acetolactate synthase small subunit [Clostridia bacterium]|jgi:acetolactate synthase-1/3 small subunit|nr:acetolactate synthase small subunit [Clostridia bacterium]